MEVEHHKLPPTLHRQPLNEAWARAGGCKQSLPRYPKGQSRTCYQECGCHSWYSKPIRLSILIQQQAKLHNVGGAS